MDRGIWATWYDLADEGRQEYLQWLHAVHLPRLLGRPGCLWAAHVQNVSDPEREAANRSRLTHTDDPSVPDGFQYLLLLGAADPHVFVDPPLEEIEAALDASERELLALRLRARASVFVEVSRVDGPEAKRRRPGITPGPVIQLGSFNLDRLEHELEMNSWYARSRFELVRPLPGNVGARRLVSIAGWAKHAILYEFTSLEAARTNLTDPDPWSRRVVETLVHAPHSPTLGTRIWPPA